jgi:hypothetical protein
MTEKDPMLTGHAMAPGTGPEGEICKTCLHRTGIQFSRIAYKCELAKAKWGHGRRTDIRLKDLACGRWEPAG